MKHSGGVRVKTTGSAVLVLSKARPGYNGDIGGLDIRILTTPRKGTVFRQDLCLSYPGY